MVKEIDDTEDDQWNDPPSIDGDTNDEPQPAPILQFFIGLWITLILVWGLAALWVVLL